MQRPRVALRVRRAAPPVACLVAVLAWITASPVLGGSRATAAPPPAAGPCDLEVQATCGVVRVPLDWSGHAPGTVSLFVERLRQQPRSPREAAIVFVGGPGQAATQLAPDFDAVLGGNLGNKEMVLFDQRGTGRSGLLRCGALERAFTRSEASDVVGSTRKCAQRLGRRRLFYTTDDSVNDTEAVRQAVGASRLTLVGISAGTQVALQYAARFPERVGHLILDSPVPAGGLDPYALSTFAAIRRVTGRLCPSPGCRDRHFVALLSRLRSRLQTVGPRARPRRGGSRVDKTDLLDTVVAGDEDPALLRLLPRAVVAALAGRPSRLRRLDRRALRLEDPGPPEELSLAVFEATQCQDRVSRWESAGRTVGDRLREARAGLASMPSAEFLPFDRATALAQTEVTMCLAWPHRPRVISAGSVVRDGLAAFTGLVSRTPRRSLQRLGSYATPALSHVLHGELSAASGLRLALSPSVPTLIISGSRDMRTPLEDAQQVASLLDGSDLLVVPNRGHNVLADPPRCVRMAISRFLSGGRAKPCVRRRSLRQLGSQH